MGTGGRRGERYHTTLFPFSSTSIAAMFLGILELLAQHFIASLWIRFVATQKARLHLLDNPNQRLYPPLVLHYLDQHSQPPPLRWDAGTGSETIRGIPIIQYPVSTARTGSITIPQRRTGRYEFAHAMRSTNCISPQGATTSPKHLPTCPKRRYALRKLGHATIVSRLSWAK